MKKTYPRAREILQNEVKKFGSVNKVSLKTGLTNNTIGKYLEGISEPQTDTLDKLSEYFNVSVAWLRGDTDIKAPQAQLEPLPGPSGLLPVVSMASANGDGPCWEDCYPVGSGLDTIWRPHDITDPRAFGVRVDGDSMVPAFRKGDTVVVCPQKQVISGDEVVAKLKDGRVVVKVIRFVNNHVLLESYNPAHEPIFTEKTSLILLTRLSGTKGGSHESGSMGRNGQQKEVVCFDSCSSNSRLNSVTKPAC